MDKLSKEKLIELVKSAKKGDKKAFSHLYEYYISPIFRFVYFRVKNYNDAEDLTQTVFLKAWNSLPDYKQNKNPFSAWLYAITRNTITDYWRKKKELNIDDSIINTAKEERPIYDVIEEEDDFRAVKDAIGLLTEDQQEVIILKFIEGLSNREIAKIIGKKDDTIRQLQSRGIKLLKEYFNKNQ